VDDDVDVDGINVPGPTSSSDQDLSLKTLGSVLFVLSRADDRSPAPLKSSAIRLKCTHPICCSSA